jgi:phosphoglycerate dehydrogenase-like enzyme
MKAGAVLVNTSRGATVDEAALVDALRASGLSGAGLDVFQVEPLPSSHPLLAMDNVVLTGHLASHTPRTLAGLVAATVAGVVAAGSGRAPVGALNAAVMSALSWGAEASPVEAAGANVA